MIPFHNNNSIILNEFEDVYIHKIISYIQDGDYVILLGPRGMGKSYILENAKKIIQQNFNYNTFLFNMEYAAENGAFAFYQQIISKVTDNKISILKNDDISEKLIDILDNNIDKKTVLLFDNLSAVGYGVFYKNFTRDCIKIFSEGKIYNDSGLSKIFLVFTTSLINPKIYQESSLWENTRKIFINPLPMEIIKIISDDILLSNDITNPEKHIYEIIYNMTKGHKFLAKATIQYILDNFNLYYLKCFDKKHFIQRYIKNIIGFIKNNNNNLNDNEKNLKDHFLYIINHLKKSDIFCKIVLSLIEKNIYNAENEHKINILQDELTITGVLIKNEKGDYFFSNIIYQEFLKYVLLNQKTAADFCLFHYNEKNLWEKAIEIYKRGHKSNNQTDQFYDDSFLFVSFEEISKNILNHLQNIKNIDNFINIFNEMITYILQIDKWSIYDLYDQSGRKKLGTIDNALVKNGNKIDINILQKFVDDIISEYSSQIDWTGNWIAIPVIIREDFQRLFVAEIQSINSELTRGLPFFIKDALTIYYHIFTKENTLKKFIDKIEIKPIEDLRKTMQSVWSFGVMILHAYDIKKYIFHEYFQNNKIITTNNGEKLNSTAIINISEYLKKIKQRIENKESLIKAANDKVFLGYSLDNSVVIILELFISHKNFELIEANIQHTFQQFYYLINEISNSFIYSKTIDVSKNYIYAIDKDYKIRFISKPLKSLLLQNNKTDQNLKEKKCYELFQFKDKCKKCYADTVFKNNEEYNTTKKYTLSNKETIMKCDYVPIIEPITKQTIAVTVFMMNVTDRQNIIKTLEKLEKLTSIEDMVKHIMESLIVFGFSRVFVWKKDKIKKNNFISMSCSGATESKEKEENFNNGKISFEDKDFFSKEARVIPWYKEEKSDDKLLIYFKNCFENSNFEFRKNISMEQFNKNDHQYLVSMPVIWGDEVQYLFNVDNNKNNEKDKQMITVDKLQLLETLSVAASQIMENTLKRYDYIDKFHGQLAHSINEPLQMARWILPRLPNMGDNNKKNEWTDVSVGAIEMVQTSLQSLVTIGKGSEIISIEKVNINEILKMQTRIFQAYAKRNKILFKLTLSDKEFFCFTDKNILILILNNIVGNAISYLQKLYKQPNKNITVSCEESSQNIIINIADNGPGLPEKVVEYFKNPFSPHEPYPTTGFGIGFSRHMTTWLDGELKIDLKGRGTIFKIILPKKYGEKNEATL